jgi:tryptophan 6-halogenase
VGVPQRIVIVGGGTAGWMCAVYLNHAFGRRVEVTLVESPAIGTIGVGEASFNTIKSFFDSVGLAEAAWMPPSHATYKLAIRFVGWNRARRTFYHPFQRYDDIGGLGLNEWWLHARSDRESFDDACFTVPALCDAARAPKTFDGQVFERRIPYPYGYHFDAGLLGAYLREVAVERGVRHVEGVVGAIDVDERGDVTQVHLDGERALAGDLFVDCSGFRGLIAQRALGEPWQSFAPSLPCDRALALRVPYDEPGGPIRPYTTATALSAGWVWDIPLKERVGTGYVYSSAFLDDDAAAEEFRRHLAMPEVAFDPMPIRFRSGRLRDSWVNNCVALGLAGSFVEPLESTTIFFIQYELLQLLHHLPSGRGDEAVRASFNRAMAECVDGVRDFLVLHYHGSDRVDSPFWAATKTDLEVPDTLAERLALWRHRLPSTTTVNPHYHGFYPYSYSVMMLGLSQQRPGAHPLLEFFDPHRADAAFAAVERARREQLALLPAHHEYLDALYAGALDAPGGVLNLTSAPRSH